MTPAVRSMNQVATAPLVRIAPEQVALATAVEVARLGNSPLGRHRTESSARRDRQAVQQPDRHRAGRVVAPKDVVFAVAVSPVPAMIQLVGTAPREPVEPRCS